MRRKESSGTTHYCPACKAPVDRVDSVCLNCEASRPPTGWPVDSYVGRVLGKKYRIDQRLSVGGFGMVFLANQVHQGQELGKVIIKMLHTEHAFDPVVTRRFVNEVRAARSILSSHVVKIFDMDFDRGNVPYMVQEFVDGEGLADVLEKSVSLPVSRSVSIALQVAEGMDEAHHQNIIHRDLKPENIILQRIKRKDFVKIIDFGIARLSAPDGMITSSFVGTPRYMSPEQIKGKEMDGRADIYALGVILFEMITGRPPIVAPDSDLEYLTLNCTQEPKRLREVDPALPQTLDDLVYAMMAKEPDDRPATMHDVVERLSQISDEMGYAMELTGEWTVPTDASTEVDVPIRGLITTPTSGDYSREIEKQKERNQPGAAPSGRRASQTSEPFTHERPASGQHDPAARPGVTLPVLAIAAGIGAFAVLVAATVLFVVVISGSGEEAPPNHAPPSSTAPPVAEKPPPPAEPEAPAQPATDASSRPEAAGTAPGDGEQAMEAPPPEEPAVPGEPGATEASEDGQDVDGAPVKEPPRKKPKPKAKKKKPAATSDPWTKI